MPQGDFIDAVDEVIGRANNAVNGGIEGLVRFCEVVLLAGAFRYASTKTLDPYLTILSFLLWLAAAFLLARFTMRMMDRVSPPRWAKGWLWWLFSLGIIGLTGWAVYGAANNLSHAIEQLAKAQITG